MTEVCRLGPRASPCRVQLTYRLGDGAADMLLSPPSVAAGSPWSCLGPDARPPWLLRLLRLLLLLLRLLLLLLMLLLMLLLLLLLLLLILLASTRRRTCPLLSSESTTSSRHIDTSSAVSYLRVDLLADLCTVQSIPSVSSFLHLYLWFLFLLLFFHLSVCVSLGIPDIDQHYLIMDGQWCCFAFIHIHRFEGLN